MSISDSSFFSTASSNEDLRQIPNKKIAKDSSGKKISEDKNYNKIKLNKGFLRENISLREEDGSNKTISNRVMAKAKSENENTSRENTMKEVIPKKPKWRNKNNISRNVVKENILNDKSPKEENEVPTALEQSIDKTPLMLACQDHNLERVQRLLRDHADDTIQTTLGETALILAIPMAWQRLSKKIKEILKLLCRNQVNWTHRYHNRNALAHAVHESNEDVVEYLLTLDPPKQAQQEALIHAFFYRMHNMSPLLNFDKTLARETPIKIFKEIRRQARAKGLGWTQTEEQYDRACRVFLVKLTYETQLKNMARNFETQLKNMTRNWNDVCVWSLYGCLEPSICISGEDMPVNY